jgi:hypothetical protein
LQSSLCLCVNVPCGSRKNINLYHGGKKVVRR